MIATVRSSRSIGKPMILIGLADNLRRPLAPQRRWSNILMNIAIPECYLFSHAQAKPNKGHMVIFSGATYDHPTARELPQRITSRMLDADVFASPVTGRQMSSSGERSKELNKQGVAPELEILVS